MNTDDEPTEKQTTPGGAEIPVPSREQVIKDLDKLARPKVEPTESADEADGSEQ